MKYQSALIRITVFISILLFFVRFAEAQSTCPAHVSRIDCAVKKPVKNNQVIVSWQTCDEDRGQSSTISITEGNTKKYFKVSLTGLLVANASGINRSTTRLYSITVQIRDNGRPAKSNKTLINISVIN